MVNIREKQVLEQYEKEGWKTVRCGAPDFLFIKIDKDKITDFFFDEVKCPDASLSYEQAIWKKVLELLGAKYRIDVVL